MCFGLPCWVHPALVGCSSLWDRTLVCVWPPSSQSFAPCLLGRDLTHDGWGSCSWDLAKGVCMDEKLSQAPKGKSSSLAVWFVLRSRVSLWLLWPKTLSHNGPRTQRLGFFWQLLARSEPRGLDLLQGWEPAAPQSEKWGALTWADTGKGEDGWGRKWWKWCHGQCSIAFPPDWRLPATFARSLETKIYNYNEYVEAGKI